MSLNPLIFRNAISFLCLLLQALHALSLADPQLCIPGKDPARFVRCLAPYLKVLPRTCGDSNHAAATNAGLCAGCNCESENWSGIRSFW